MAKYHGRGRQSIRLPGYDYAQPGAYFITVCTYHRIHLFGEIANDIVRLSEFGHLVQAVWDDLPNHYAHVVTDAFVIMPNHIHGIIVLDPPIGAGLKPAPTKGNHGLTEIVRGLKTFSARHINKRRNTTGTHIWQRGYHEHIIRNDGSIDRIREYIVNNPMKWGIDRENPDQTPTPSSVREEPTPWEI